MLDTKREKFLWLEKRVGRLFSGLPLSPNQYTILSLLFVSVSFYFLVNENFISALAFFMAAGFMDFVDGAVARHQNISTKIGAYLDTIIDRYVEGIILLGMLFLPLPAVIFPGYVWIFLILFGSTLTTYAKAAAKEKELTALELKGGFLSRGERIILILISLTFGAIDPSLSYMAYILISIAILSNLTALQRIYSAIKSNSF